MVICTLRVNFGKKAGVSVLKNFCLAAATQLPVTSSKPAVCMLPPTCGFLLLFCLQVRWPRQSIKNQGNVSQARMRENSDAVSTGEFTEGRGTRSDASGGAATRAPGLLNARKQQVLDRSGYPTLVRQQWNMTKKLLTSSFCSDSGPA